MKTKINKAEAQKTLKSFDMTKKITSMLFSTLSTRTKENRAFNFIIF